MKTVVKLSVQTSCGGLRTLFLILDPWMMIILACFEHGLKHRTEVVVVVAVMVPQEIGECGSGEQPASHCGQVFVAWISMIKICEFFMYHRYP